MFRVAAAVGRSSGTTLCGERKNGCKTGRTVPGAADAGKGGCDIIANGCVIIRGGAFGYLRQQAPFIPCLDVLQLRVSIDWKRPYRIELYPLFEPTRPFRYMEVVGGKVFWARTVIFGCLIYVGRIRAVAFLSGGTVFRSGGYISSSAKSTARLSCRLKGAVVAKLAVTFASRAGESRKASLTGLSRQKSFSRRYSA